MFFAIVTKENTSPINRGLFVSKDRLQAITSALKAKQNWEKTPGCGPYQVFVGQLTHEIVPPTPVMTFEEVPLETVK